MNGSVRTPRNFVVALSLLAFLGGCSSYPLRDNLKQIPPELAQQKIARPDVLPPGLWILIRFPSAPADAATLPAIDRFMMSHFKPISSAFNSTNVNTASDFFVRSTYLALELYKAVSRKVPKDKVALWPVSVAFDGASVTMHQATDQPPAWIVIDVSAITMPAYQPSADCGTCSIYFEPYLFYSFPIFTRNSGNSDLVCSSWDATSMAGGVVPIQKFDWDTVSSRNMPGHNGGRTWLDLALNGASPEILRDHAQFSREIRGGNGIPVHNVYPAKSPRKPEDGDLVRLQLPGGMNRWDDTNLKASAFDLDSTTFSNWGGKFPWAVDSAIWTLDMTSRYFTDPKYMAPTLQRTSFREADRVARLYGLSVDYEKAERIDPKVAAAMDAEAAFMARISDAYFDSLYRGDWGRLYRDRLVSEEDIDNHANHALVAMLLTAGVAGFAAGAQGVPIGDPSVIAQSYQIANAFSGAANPVGDSVKEYQQAGYAITVSLDGKETEVRASALGSFREQLKAIVNPPPPPPPPVKKKHVRKKVSSS